MGREIRRVPSDWVHPTDDEGHDHPLHDAYYLDALDDWFAQHKQWQDGTHPDLLDKPERKADYPFYAEWGGDPPALDYYRTRNWTEAEATHYQIYETVTEGTPVSPVFATLDDIIAWLISEGYSEKAVRSFADSGWVPSMMVVGGTLYSDIHAGDAD